MIIDRTAEMKLKSEPESRRTNLGEAPFGVLVAVNRPVRVAVAEVLVRVPGLEVVMVIPGQALEEGYHTPLIMTPSSFKMLRIESFGHVSVMARIKQVGLGFGGGLRVEVAFAEPVVL